ncbi:MAG: endonuclease III [Planctomycetota bacterium]|nr:endonuclease III [Planctomycetota bacterium]
MSNLPSPPYYELDDERLTPVLEEVDERLKKLFGRPDFERRPIVDELVLTILSQNTNDRNRDKAFRAMKERYPDWNSVADADEEELVEVLRPAGLAPRKAPRIRNILRSARENGDIEMKYLADMAPQEAEEHLLNMHGVGIKTAYCVLLFSMRHPVYPMDTHVMRVFKRLSLLPSSVNAQKAHRKFSRLVPKGRHEPFHLNVIKLGRKICKARNADCPNCPLSEICHYASEGNREQ